ncbi:MAG TPA: ABC transporter substrate-binding protein [Acetobacteraceae bacterium]|jgi:peptide/nickel transport system substrate-binding protein|nr:ABC transporter substrate-binding protein [Acetobacteraceae bacterium]
MARQNHSAHLPRLACLGGLLASVTLTGTAAAQGPMPSGTIKARMGGDWDTLDPQRARATYGYQMIYSLYDRLVSLEDGKIVPSLAASWEVGPNEITLKLRQGVTCADGSPITPEVVAASLQRLGAADTKAPYAYRTLGRSGFTVTPDAAAGTVRLTLSAPNSDLLLGLAMPWASIICKAGLDHPDTLAAQSAGSGPFTLAEVKRGDSYTLKARPDYAWGPTGASTAVAGFPQTLVFRVIDNQSTAANLLLTHELDTAYIFGQDIDRLSHEPGLTRIDAMAIGAEALTFHQGSGHPTADPQVRRALALAIDGNAYNRAAYFGYGRTMNTLTTPTMNCYDESLGKYAIPIDPEGAKKLLAQDGWKPDADGKLAKNGQKLVIRIVGSKTQNSGPEYILEALTDLGVTASVNVSDFPSWIDLLVKTDNWDVTVDPLGSVMPSPSIFYGQLAGAAPPNGGNFPRIQNAAYEAAAARAMTAAPADRCPDWHEAERAMLDANDVKPLVVQANAVFSRNVTLKMFTVNVLSPISLRIVK